MSRPLRGSPRAEIPLEPSEGPKARTGIPCPSISVVIPARDEGTEPEPLIRSLTGAEDVLEICLVLPEAESIPPWVDEAGQVRVIHAPAGRASQMNEGARQARGEVLLFLHADSRLRPRAPRVAVDALARRAGVGAVAFRHAFREPQRSLQVLSSLGRLAVALAPYPFGDQGLALRRDHFFELGGFPEVPILEDWLFARRLRKNGGLRLLPEPCYTSGRRFLRNGVARQTWSNLRLLLRFAAGADLQELAREYDTSRSSGGSASPETRRSLGRETPQ